MPRLICVCHLQHHVSRSVNEALINPCAAQHELHAGKLRVETKERSSIASLFMEVLILLVLVGGLVALFDPAICCLLL